MKRICVKTIAMLLLAIMVATIVTTMVFADGGYDGIIDELNNKNDTSGARNSVMNFAGAILSIAKVVGVGVAVIMLIVLAIKYISAAPGDKAEIKKHATVYVVGAVLLFSASGVLAIIEKFAKNVKAD